MGDLIFSLRLLSLVGSGFVLFMYIKVKELRTFAFKLISLLALTDFLMFLHLEMRHVFPEFQYNNFMCITSAILILYFSLTTLFFTCLITFVLYLAVIKQKDDI